MPYSPEHKAKTRQKITEAARILFNRHGYHGVTIDMVMAHAGLTRGGFYNHFKNKDALFSASVVGFLTGRGAQWRAEAGVDPAQTKPEMADNMIDGYLSAKHLSDLEGQCPMIALPSDVARATPEVQKSYQKLLDAMVWLFETNLEHNGKEQRQQALSLAALCVGGMVLARTLPDSQLAEEVRAAAHTTAKKIAKDMH